MVVVLPCFRYRGNTVFTRFHCDEAVVMVTYTVLLLLLLGLKHVAVGDVDVETREVTHRHSTVRIAEMLRVHLDLLVVARLVEPGDEV